MLGNPSIVHACPFRCLLAILGDYYCEAILTDGYKFSDSGDYFSPPEGEYDTYVEYIQSLPLSQTPDLFGLHANADITKVCTCQRDHVSLPHIAPVSLPPVWGPGILPPVLKYH